jgi:hypothetical protein
MGLWALRLVGFVLFSLAFGCGGVSERSGDAGDTSGGSSTGGTAPAAGGRGGRPSGSGGTIPIPEGGVGEGGIDPYLCGGADVSTDSIVAGSCAFATPPKFPDEPFDPDDGNYLNLLVTREGEAPTPLFMVENPDLCRDELGWYFAAAGPETIVLCPAACDLVLTTGVGLGVVYGCDGDPPPLP